MTKTIPHLNTLPRKERDVILAIAAERGVTVESLRKRGFFYFRDFSLEHRAYISGLATTPCDGGRNFVYLRGETRSWIQNGSARGPVEILHPGDGGF